MGLVTLLIVCFYTKMCNHNKKRQLTLSGNFLYTRNAVGSVSSFRTFRETPESRHCVKPHFKEGEALRDDIFPRSPRQSNNELKPRLVCFQRHDQHKAQSLRCEQARSWNRFARRSTQSLTPGLV